ncbi:MAG: hypothetical protein OEY52_08870 [Gammaproteobacteria bacterium]|nr:hypothetical protein [Gammaproteobacteria bacterium]
MSKKIAVLVRGRQEEALRMAIGLTLLDDTIDIFLPNQKLIRTDKSTLNIDTIQEMEMDLYSNIEQGYEVKILSSHELANRLLDYDHVLPY